MRQELGKDTVILGLSSPTYRTEKSGDALGQRLRGHAHEPEMVQKVSCQWPLHGFQHQTCADEASGFGGEKHGIWEAVLALLDPAKRGLDIVVNLERGDAAEQRESNHTECPDIHGKALMFAAHHFWRHVIWCARPRPWSHLPRQKARRKAEVTHLES